MLKFGFTHVLVRLPNQEGIPSLESPVKVDRLYLDCNLNLQE